MTRSPVSFAFRFLLRISSCKSQGSSAALTSLKDSETQPTADDRLALHTRLAAICRDELSDTEGCIEHLEVIAESVQGTRPDEA